MDHGSRLIGLAFVVAWTIFRLVRYLRAGASRRPPPAIPPGTLGQVRSGSPAAPAATASPIEPGASAGIAPSLLAAAVFIPGTVVIWSLLFMVPAIGNVPPVLRMIAGALATLCLIQLARSVAARVGGAGQRADAEDNNPLK